jgi:hypothetical protein
MYFEPARTCIMCVYVRMPHTGRQDLAKATTTLTSNSNQRQGHPIFRLYVRRFRRIAAGRFLVA